MKFNYQARTKEGDVHAGFIEASSSEFAVTLLRDRGLYVTFLEEAVTPFYAKKIELFGGVSQKELVFFSRQLAIMFKSKISLVESLRVLCKQTKNIGFREKILRVSEDIEGGTSFSEALSYHPKTFSPFYVAMVKSGEASGKLSDVLNYLAFHLEREYHLMSKTKGALVYPAFIVFVILLVLIMMILFVLPNLIEVLEASHAELPVVTKMVISLSDFARSWGWALFLGLVFFLVFIFRYRATENGKRFFDKLFLKTPIVGSFLQMIYITRFAENLSTLTSGGLHISKSLEVVGDIIGNDCYKETILEARDEIRKGEMISSVLEKSPWLFPPVFVQMVSVGEKTGSLSTTLMSMVDFYQKEVDRRIESILSILEPVLIVFLGFVVGGLMFAVLMPLYQTVML